MCQANYGKESGAPSSVSKFPDRYLEEAGSLWYITSMVKKGWPLALWLVLLGFSAGACTFSNTPRRSLEELRTALLHHDAQGALHYVDVDSIVAGLVDDMVAQYEAKANNPLESLALAIGKGASKSIMPGLQALARKEFERAVAAPDESRLFRDLKRVSVWYFRIEMNGDIAFVEPKFQSDIRFGMAKAPGGYWKIVRIMRTVETREELREQRN